MNITITEALAEVKTLGKRIEKKKKEFVHLYALRQEMVKDPLEKDGGSVKTLNGTMRLSTCRFGPVRNGSCSRRCLRWWERAFFGCF